MPQIAKMLALTVTGLGCSLAVTAVSAGPKPAPTVAETKARAVCVAEAQKLKRKLPPGTCEDPRSGFRRAIAARELCERQRNITKGELQCRRNQQAD